MKGTVSISAENREQGISLIEVLIGILLTLLVGTALFSLMQSYYRTQSISRQLSLRTADIAIMKEALEHTVVLSGYCGANTAALNSVAGQEIGVQIPGLLSFNVNSTALNTTIASLNTFLSGCSNNNPPQVTPQAISVTWTKLDPQTGLPVSCMGTLAAATSGVLWTIASSSSLCSPGVAFYPVGAGWSFSQAPTTTPTPNTPQCMGYVGNGPVSAIVATQSSMAAVVTGTTSTSSSEVTVCLPNP
ncbi:hypothetical protein [Acidithiobacillus thiooxidans]|uniref:PulJ/GspJ family protein n=1 Tax=Acidithiobacillus thiooxidans TaxID=930 RepID=UPI00242C0A09|nr:hypothetical protein [Acidithiobacillus thiooxidans]